MSQVFTITLDDKDWTATCEHCGLTIDRTSAGRTILLGVPGLFMRQGSTLERDHLNKLAEELKQKIDAGQNTVVIHDPETHQITELATMESALKNHARRCAQRRT